MKEREKNQRDEKQYQNDHVIQSLKEQILHLKDENASLKQWNIITSSINEQYIEFKNDVAGEKHRYQRRRGDKLRIQKEQRDDEEQRDER